MSQLFFGSRGGPGVSVLGDSISTLAGWVPDGWRVHYGGEVVVRGIESPRDTWWGRVIEGVGGHLVANSSYSGSVVEGFGFPAGCSEERARALVGRSGELPDIVLVLMGINDYGWAGGRNQVMGGSVSASARPEELGPPYEVGALADRGTLDRFEDAYERMLGLVSRVAPGADVWCLTLSPGSVSGDSSACFKWRIRGVGLDEYNEAIRRACARTGACVADLRSFGVDFDSIDGAHPTALGMRQIADMVLAQMSGLADPLIIPSLSGAPASRMACDRGSCAGCPSNEDSPSRWTIVCHRVGSGS